MSYEIFQKCVQTMIDTDRFYAGMVQQCRRVFTTDPKICPTAGVSMRTSMQLLVNSEWMKTWTVEFGTKVMKHEMLHLILGHITRVKAYPDYKMNLPFYNICMDLAVNSLIDFPNEFGGMKFCTIENYAKQGIVLEPRMPFEYYVEKLKPHATKATGAGFETADDHSGFAEEGDGTPQEVIEQTLRHAVKNAYHMAKDAGNIPGELQTLIDAVINTKSVNNWKRELRNFPQDCEVVDFESTRNRRNRRYGFMYPGSRAVRASHLGLGFDVSGSMWDDATIAALQNEVNEIKRAANCKLTVMFFDTRVTTELVLEANEDLDLRGKHKATGGGGTDFGPVFERAKQLNLDGIIMATDGEAGLDLSYAKPCIWAIYEKARAENFTTIKPFGKVLHIEAAS